MSPQQEQQQTVLSGHLPAKGKICCTQQSIHVKHDQTNVAITLYSSQCSLQGNSQGKIQLVSHSVAVKLYSRQCSIPGSSRSGGQCTSVIAAV